MRGHIKERKKGGLSDHIYTKLKEMIFSGHLRPYETLNLRELSRMFEASVTPINTALSMLAKEGLVTKEPNKSCVVAAMTIDQVRDVWLTGALLEGLAAYLATPKIPAEQIKVMEDIIEEMRALRIPDDIVRLTGLNQAFHRIFIRPCGNKGLLGIIKESSMKLHRYHALATSLDGALSDFVRQHNLIVENIRARDPRGTRDAVEGHILSAGEKVVKCLQTITLDLNPFGLGLGLEKDGAIRG